MRRTKLCGVDLDAIPLIDEAHQIPCGLQEILHVIFRVWQFSSQRGSMHDVVPQIILFFETFGIEFVMPHRREPRRRLAYLVEQINLVQQGIITKLA